MTVISRLFLTGPSIKLHRCAGTVVLNKYKHQYRKQDSRYESFSFNNITNNLHITISVLGITWFVIYKLKQNIACAEVRNPHDKPPGQFVNNLPTYKSSVVAKHASKENGVWVTYKQGVYDVTGFVDQHPGGSKILLAAGGSVEPYWLLYGVHNTSEVYNMLEQYRIGNLDATDLLTSASVNSSDPYSGDPVRHPALKPASVKPFNAEPPASLLVDNFYTPNELFYVRNHLPVPSVDTSKYKLTVSGIGVKTTQLSLDDIKKFPAYEVSAAVQCAGNRRSEMVKVKPVKGLNWQQAAIGNAKWRGARLMDVLHHCGLKQDGNIAHVQFEGLDTGPDKVPYGASVPAETALNPKSDVLLAYEMNGQPLPQDHGFPLRVIVPGVVGARNVKWLSSVTLSAEESSSHWQQNDYKGFSPSTDWDTVDFSTSPAIQELPVISAICSPEDGDTIELIEGMVCVKGYAWSGGGRKIVRVDVSCDNGKTWHVADLEQTEDKTSAHWSWTLWTTAIPVQPDFRQVEIWAKAVDSSYNTQPESFEHIWNLRGVLGNAYHKVKVNISK